MPEGLEAEIWRRSMQRLVGRAIERVEADERTVPDGFVDAVVGERIAEIGRAGKVVLVHTSGPSIGVHLGMTGRIVVDGAAPIERLEYSSGADRPEWDRLLVWTSGSRDPAIRVNDPRRLGRTSLDADLRHLGTDLLAPDRDELEMALARRRTALKAALMNQVVVAGLGNLCTDEVLFVAGLAPDRAASSLEKADLDELVSAMQRSLPVMLERGGSTEGLIDPDRRRQLGACPRSGCGGALRRSTIGGRTTVWCPSHQR